MKFYYVNIQSFECFDYETTYTKDEISGFDKISNFGLVLIPTPADSLLTLHGYFFATETLAAKFRDFPCVEVEHAPVERIHSATENSNENTMYFKINFIGLPMLDDFSVYNHYHLVVSENGLDFLRKFGVTEAESNCITKQVDEYFSNFEHLFWMKPQMRDFFIKNRQI
jgi:hypothetical protein